MASRRARPFGLGFVVVPIAGWAAFAVSVIIVRTGFACVNESKLNATLNPHGSPECLKHGFSSDEYRKCQAKYHALTTHHLVCTCKLGPRINEMAVTGKRLSVCGVNNLRVVDASIMPTITKGNTNALAIMIAEKASDAIEEDALKAEQEWVEQ